MTDPLEPFSQNGYHATSMSQITKKAGVSEPAANLDSNSTENLLNIMEQLNKKEKITFIFSTHDQRVVNKARRVVTLEDGKIISDITKKNKAMKVKIALLLLLCFRISLAIDANSPGHSEWEIQRLNTAAEVHYLSLLEKEIILEINKLRSNPKRYAEKYLEPLAGHYNRKLLNYPGDQPILTNEGISALYECVVDLKNQQNLPIVSPNEGLTKAARDHVKDQSKTGHTGHQGSDRSTMRDRIERYGTWEKRIAENIAYGGNRAQQIVIYLLIDDGVRDRGHRKNFLNPDFNMVGVATGSHPGYGLMSVIDFAGGFKTVKNDPIK